MPGPQLLFVIGKGGAGKTTVAAALATRAARDGRRVLIVELSTDRGLATLFGAPPFSTEPTALAPRLHGVRLDTDALLESYFRRLLRLPFLSRPLLASAAFRAVARAAPGVSQFLVLERLMRWVRQRGWRGRAPYDWIVVDGPATGHAVQLLRTPQDLTAMIQAGPLAAAAKAVQALVTDPKRTRVIPVTTPDSMAVSETVATRNIVRDELGLRMTRPVLNRVTPRRFTRGETREILALAERRQADPLMAAALLQIQTHRNDQRHASRLRRAFGVAPVRVPQFHEDQPTESARDIVGKKLAAALD